MRELSPGQTLPCLLLRFWQLLSRSQRPKGNVFLFLHSQKGPNQPFKPDVERNCFSPSHPSPNFARRIERSHRLTRASAGLKDLSCATCSTYQFFFGLAWLCDALHELVDRGLLFGRKDELAVPRVSCGEGARRLGGQLPGSCPSPLSTVV